jgi:hypothetical protein
MRLFERIKILGLSSLVAVSLVACSSSPVNTEKAGAAIPNGVFTDKQNDGSQNDFLVVAYYPNGMFVETVDGLLGASSRPVAFVTKIGICRPDGSRIDCRQTAASSLESNNTVFQSSDVEFSFQIKKAADGSFRTMELNRTEDGKAQAEDGNWSNRFVPLKAHDMIAAENALIKRIPKKFLDPHLLGQR